MQRIKGGFYFHHFSLHKYSCKGKLFNDNLYESLNSFLFVMQIKMSHPISLIMVFKSKSSWETYGENIGGRI